MRSAPVTTSTSRRIRRWTASAAAVTLPLAGLSVWTDGAHAGSATSSVASTAPDRGPRGVLHRAVSVPGRGTTPEQVARNYLADHRHELGIDGPVSALHLIPVARPDLVQRFSQTVRGRPVQGAQVIVRLSRQGNGFTVTGVSSSYVPGMKEPAPARVSLDAATQVAADRARAAGAERFSLVDGGLALTRDGTLVRQIHAQGKRAGVQGPWSHTMLVDAAAGSIVGDLDRVQGADEPVTTSTNRANGQAVSVHLTRTAPDRVVFDGELLDPRIPMDVRVQTYAVSSDDYEPGGRLPVEGAWLIDTDTLPLESVYIEKGVVDAHWGADWSARTLAGIGGFGGIVALTYRSLVYYAPSGNDLPVTAEFVASPLSYPVAVYGQPSAGHRPDSATLDLVGHEWAHGLATSWATLNDPQEKAIDEALSDVLGNYVENEHDAVTPADDRFSLIGETRCLSGTMQDCALRDLSRPVTTADWVSGPAPTTAHANSLILSSALDELLRRSSVADRSEIYSSLVRYLMIMRTTFDGFSDARRGICLSLWMSLSANRAALVQAANDAFDAHGITLSWTPHIGDAVPAGLNPARNRATAP